MPHNRYFCHACQEEFEAQEGQTLQCTHCGSDFVERMTELTFTREERQQRQQSRRQQEGGISHDNATTDGNEEGMEGMLFGPQGILSTFAPVVIDMESGRESREGEGGEDRENTHQHTRRRSSFGHNLVHNVIPRVLRRVLHRHNQSGDEQEQSTEHDSTVTNQGNASRNAPHISFGFASPSGGRAQIAIFTRDSYK